MWEILGALVFLVLFLVILILGLIVTAVSASTSTFNAAPVTASTLPPCSLNPSTPSDQSNQSNANALDSLNVGQLDLSETPCCCNGSTLTGQRYYPAFDMVIGPNPFNNALAVCVGYCNNGYDGEICRPGGISGQDKFDACMKQFNPEGICTGLIRPIGHIDTVLYYPLAVGRVGICSSTISSRNPAFSPGTCISTIDNICSF